VVNETVPVASLAATGVAVSTLLFAPVCVLLHRLTRERFGEAVGRRTVVYLALFPLAFVFSACLHREPVPAVHAGRVPDARARPRLVGLGLRCPGHPDAAGRPAARARLRVAGVDGRRPSLAPLGRARTPGRPVAAGRLAPVALLPLAQIGFQIYLYLVTGQVFASGAAESRGWGREVDVMLVLELPVAWATALWELFVGGANGDLVLSGVMASIWAWLLIEAVARRRLPGEYVIFSGGCLLLAALTGTYLGIPRFFVVAFPLFWLMALHGRNEHVDHSLRAAMPALMAVLAFVAYGVGTFTP
jgi:hypothetical protein